MQNLIEQYIQAFNQGNLEEIKSMFSPQVTLQDPNVGLVQGFDQVVALYQEMFAGNLFQAALKRQYSSGSSFAFEFSLLVTPKTGGNPVHLDGVDLIETENGKIQSIRAYLDLRP